MNITKHPLYSTWQGMKQRCLNPNAKTYKHYGGRGITICEKWVNSFEAFCEDVGPRPSLDYSIDRKDVNGHYEPANCRWATEVEQANNRTNSRTSKGLETKKSYAVYLAPSDAELLISEYGTLTNALIAATG